MRPAAGSRSWSDSYVTPLGNLCPPLLPRCLKPWALRDSPSAAAEPIPRLCPHEICVPLFGKCCRSASPVAALLWYGRFIRPAVVRLLGYAGSGVLAMAWAKAGDEFQIARGHRARCSVLQPLSETMAVCRRFSWPGATIRRSSAGPPWSLSDLPTPARPGSDQWEWSSDCL